MTSRVVMAVLLAVIVVIAAIELSAWMVGRQALVVPAASVSDPAVPQASEVDVSAPTPAPALTW